MDDAELVAYEIQAADDLPIERAPARRAWMDESYERFAYRCLPLAIANQCGWVIGCPASFSAWWNGGELPGDVTLDFGGEEPDARITGHFGLGVVTFSLPYLFRTPPGVQLWVKGPSNLLKDGVQPLEGVVETDWSVATFTMNWKLTRPGLPVFFDEGEPFCMVVPQSRGELASFAPELRALASDAELEGAARAWAQRRHEMAVRKFLGEYARDFADEALEWERHYFKGLRPDGTRAPEHETHLRLAEFSDNG